MNNQKIVTSTPDPARPEGLRKELKTIICPWCGNVEQASIVFRHIHYICDVCHNVYKIAGTGTQTVQVKSALRR